MGRIGAGCPRPRQSGRRGVCGAWAGTGYAGDQLDAAGGVAQQHVVHSFAKLGQLVDPAGEVRQRMAIPRHRLDVLDRHAGIIAAVSLLGEHRAAAASCDQPAPLVARTWSVGH